MEYTRTKTLTGNIGTDGFNVVLTKEVKDRDGEVVDIDGISIDSYIKNPVLIDAHNINGSVVQTVLGRLKNLTKTKDANGVKLLSGVAEFADTPNGNIARKLVEEGYLKTVSIGFGVLDYDAKDMRISKSELYETSLVSVPANVQATIGKSLKADERIEDAVVKRLKNYDYIKPVLKEYRNFVQDNDLRALLAYEPTGDELIDLKNIFDLIHLRLKAEDSGDSGEPAKPSQNDAPKPETITITREELQSLVTASVEEVLQNLT